ncbi:MAG: immunoglobulin-like domain-containing protein [Roseburia sp.]
MMKNKSFILLPVLLLVFVLAGCEKTELKAVNEAVISTQYAAMVVDTIPDALNADSISFVIQNVSDVDLSYDEIVFLNRMDDGVWYDVPSQITDIPEVSYGISPGKESTYKLMLEEHFGELDAGHYRIIKPVYGVGSEEVVVAEFDLK